MICQITGITDLFGNEATVLPLGELTALPATDREMTTSWQAPMLGRYTAVANVEYGPDLYTFDTTKESPSVTFWVISWQAIAIAFVVLLTVLWMWTQRTKPAVKE